MWSLTFCLVSGVIAGHFLTTYELFIYILGGISYFIFNYLEERFKS